MSIRSMTGYGSGEADTPRGHVTVEIRAVNHRFLDVRCRAPVELSSHSPFAEDHARNRLERGRIEIVLRLDPGPNAGSTLDRERARRAHAELSSLRDEIAPGEPVPFSLLSLVPDLFSPAHARDGEKERDAVIAATKLACNELDEMRVREGTALAADLRERVALILRHASAIESTQVNAVGSHAIRLRERIARLLEGSTVTLDSGRLEQEVALLADRTDVTEEITRLRSHATQLEELIAGGGAIGRRMDFVIQEMNREVNTIGAKSADATVARTIVDLKAELERMREQVQNVV